jgi:large subunit ribosomal protein L25
VAENPLAAEVRTGTGKGVARKLRAAGRIPAVVYGYGKTNQSISVDPRALDQLLHKSGAGLNTLIALQLEGGARTVLLKDLQRDPVKGFYLHADFHEIDLTETVEVTVPIHFEGTARGEEMGAVVDHPYRELEVECLPTAIPDHFVVDVSRLDIGDSIHAGEIAMPEGVALRTDPEVVVASCMQPTLSTEPTEEIEGEEVSEAEGEAAEGAEAPEGGEAS